MLSCLELPLRIYTVCVCALLGLVMGSALNCLAMRLVSGQKWSGGRSRCPHCRHALSPLDLVPLFSWLFLRGKCRYCGEKISPRYPLTEALLALIFVSLLLKFDLRWETLELMILCACLFCLSLVDLDSQIIPDRFLVISAVTRFAFLLVTFGPTADFLSAGWYALWHGLVLGGSVLLLSLLMDKVLHKESMGGGDIKLLFVLGLYFDLPCCFLLMITGCILGIVLAMWLGAKKDIAFPFGPALSAAAWLTLLFGPGITGWYLSLF
ncbi:MAG: prepilin peptidase [Firmicutes bacterium]|nr:prepilin peptidase [Bacillota bacterium]